MEPVVDGSRTSPAAPGGAGIGRRPRAAFLALGLLSAFGPISLDLYLPALPSIRTDLSTSAPATQLTLSAALAGLALGQLVVGPLSDRLGRRTPLLVGLVGFAVMSVLCALAPGIEVLVVARVLQGMCGAAGVVVARAVVRDAFPDHRVAEVFSLLMLVNGLAPVLAPLAGGALLHVVPWRGLFWVLCPVGAAIGALTALAVPDTLPVEHRHRGGLRTTLAAAGEVFGDPVFRTATAVLALASCVLFTYISLSSFVLQSEYGLSASAFSVTFAVNSVGIVIGGRVGARLARRVPSATLVVVGLVVMATACAVLLVGAMSSRGVAVLLPALFVAISSVGIVFPHATALALLGHARRAGTASALLGTLQYLAGAVVGPVVSSAGVSAVTMATGMTVAAATALALWTVRTVRAARARVTGRDPAPGFAGIGSAPAGP